VLRGKKDAIRGSKLRMGLPYELAGKGLAASRVGDSTAAPAGVLPQRCVCVLACVFWLPWDLGNAGLCSAGLTTGLLGNGNIGRTSRTIPTNT
jgi:hypothetical protein